MDPLSLFTLALGLPAPWEVVDVACENQAGSISTAPSPRGHDSLVRIVGRNTSRSTTRLSATGVT